MNGRGETPLLPPGSRPRWLRRGLDCRSPKQSHLWGLTVQGVWQGPLTTGPSSTQVFGLGNKTYEHFNAMGKYVDKRLEQLGAQRIFDLGLGDDDGK